MTTALNPTPSKGVIILDGADGTPVIATIYNPRFDRETHQIHDELVSLNVGGTNRLTFTVGLMIKPDAKAANAEEIYAQARKEALQHEAESLPVMATQDDLMALNFRTHEEAIAAVYFAGVQAGARNVQFRDAHVEEEINAIRVRTWGDAVRTVRNVLYRVDSRRQKKGLNKALKALESETPT